MTNPAQTFSPVETFDTTESTPPPAEALATESRLSSSEINPPPVVARGTLANVALPGAAFHRDEFDVELSQTSLAEADELLKATLDEAMRVVGGTRAFLALVDTMSGELALRFTVGDGWTDDIRRLRVNVHGTIPEAEKIRRANGARQGITRHVVVNGRAYWTGNVGEDPHYISFFDDVESEVAVPITARGGGTIGVINVESTLPNAFNETHANALAVLARRCAVIIAMAEHQLREEALIAIGKDFNSAADLDTLMQDVVQQATKILRADDCSIFLDIDGNEENLELVASHGPLSEQVGLQGVSYALGEGLTGWVAQHEKVIRVGDPRTDPRWKGLFMEAPAGEIAAVMAVPVLCQRGKPGVLRVIRHRKGSLYFLPHEFTQADEDVFVTLAGQLAVAIDRTRLMVRLLTAERMAAWGEMSARSAHMIGNTVFGIKGHVNELFHLLNTDRSRRSGETAPDRAADATLSSEEFGDARLLVENVTRGIYRLEEILSEFRDFVLATQLHLAEHDLNHVLRTVTAESFPKHSNIDLVLNLAPGLPTVPADEVKLKRAFSELIENSIDFQPHGGMLTIRTSLAEDETVRQFLRGHGGSPVVQIEFIDHGPGLTEQDRQRVFTPFYTRKAKGMGLGLSIVKGIIEAHRGMICEIGDGDMNRQVRATKAKPSGAHFLILIPAAVQTNEETTP
jgi:signal transduction histidine kinase